MATGKINNYMAYINDAFIVRTLDKDNISIAANTTFSETFTIPTVSGYTCIGAVGFAVSNATSSGTNTSYIAIRQTRKTNATDIVIAGRNTGSNAAKVRLWVDALFVRSIFA